MSHRVRHSATGEGARLNTVDSTATVKISSTDTADVYELFEIEAPAGPGVPPHRHPWAEAYYVLEGELDVLVGARTFRLDPGASVTVPPNALHAIESVSPLARFLAFSLTPGTGKLFEDLDRSVPAGAPIEDVVPVILEVATRNGVVFAGPPPA